jgi:hypothetical protein
MANERQQRRYALKNVHTGVSAIKTIAEIEECLGQMGATGILKSMDKGENRVHVTAVIFQMSLNDRNYRYRLPMEIEKARSVIKEMVELKIIPYKFSQEPLCTERAEMVGWRIVKDWIYAQLSLSKMNLADSLQIFLPFLWNGENTFGELFMMNQLSIPNMRGKE